MKKVMDTWKMPGHLEGIKGDLRSFIRKNISRKREPMVKRTNTNRAKKCIFDLQIISFIILVTDISRISRSCIILQR
jgi:hypothetical protein